MNRIAALVAIVLVALAAVVLPSAPAWAQEPAAPVRLDVDAMSPRVVTATGPPELVVTGSITNTGTGPVDELSVRVQRGAAAADEAGVRATFAGEPAVDDAVPPFTTIGTLAPGATIPFRYAVPLTGAPGTTLALPEPGAYPLLVNLNGTVDGLASRLAEVRTVLPVSSLPGDPQPGGTPRPPARPVTMLYPITDAPRRLPPVPGQVPLLTDDDLAVSFAPGGRLYGLVEAVSGAAPAGSPARAALCLAVDPELVATATAMQGGYEVVTGPDGATAPGRGAEAAGRWLAMVQSAARGTCVVALPPADADLVGLVRGGRADLARTALARGRENLTGALDTPVVENLVWPTDGVLDEPTLDALGGVALVLSTDGVSSPDRSGVVRLGDPAAPATATLSDPLLTEAAAEPPGVALQVGDGGGLAGQDLAGALTFRVADDDPGPGPVLVAPPHRWDADGATAIGALTALATLIDDGRLVPAGAGGIATGPGTAGTDARLFYPPQVGATEIPGPVIETVGEQIRTIESLRSAAEPRTGVGATITEVFDPLVLGTLRAASSWWRGDPDRAEREGRVVAERIEQIRASVRVVQPPSPYSLGTSDAPLLVTVANGLPVTMNVRVVLSSTAGLRVNPVPVQPVPPSGRVQVRISAQVTRSGQFSVDAGLRTPDGAVLGPDTRLRVRSTVYGTVTGWLTAAAGAVLVVLVVRRVVRRIRSAGRSGRPGGPPGPGGNGAPEAPGGPAGPVPSGGDAAPVPEHPDPSGAPGPARPGTGDRTGNTTRP
ncbi:DUF6049 family protein [Pseudonocardia sp. HH130630-07]|uniref:DUF6049 family protein n=1 Tax=Pseudonocardia sp. HH130630-07 TaxID=1690815 RepID=UPI00081509AB|nr:DUF6049 family protein [Pseudonocardia sp. HH130630-07]ANY06772.1 hypothetical protein AFB00_11265 [Pseudonocardia sp. HH130630-07]